MTPTYWQQGQIIPVLAQPTARELLRVLAYPKFRLQSGDRERLLEDLLPWCETWSAAIPRSRHCVRDPNDQLFLDLALKQEVVPLQIINPADFQSWLVTNT
ncbi:MAG: PIN domain-containing protein [Cyanobacteria bacterium]|nr:PIN domain-containing protein [Cyanobacteria bacterium bin.275]